MNNLNELKLQRKFLSPSPTPGSTSCQGVPAVVYGLAGGFRLGTGTDRIRRCEGILRRFQFPRSAEEGNHLLPAVSEAERDRLPGGGRSVLLLSAERDGYVVEGAERVHRLGTVHRAEDYDHLAQGSQTGAVRL